MLTRQSTGDRGLDLVLGGGLCVVARHPIRRAVIGDLRALRSFAHAASLREGVATLAAQLRRRGAPTIVFETTAPRASRTWRGPSEWEIPRVDEPAAVDFADVTVEVRSSSPYEDRWEVRATNVRTGRRLDTFPLHP